MAQHSPIRGVLLVLPVSIALWIALAWIATAMLRAVGLVR